MAPTMEVNSFPVETPNGVAFVYDVSIEVETTVAGKKNILLNKEKSDATDKTNCRAILKIAFEKSKFFGVKRSEYVYDGSACLYYPVDFKAIDIRVEPHEMPPTLQSFFRNNVLVSIKPTMTSHEIKLNTPLEKMTKDVLSEYRKFLSLALCQDAIERGVYAVLNQGSLFEVNDAQEARSCIEYRRGFTKGIRIAFNESKKALQAVFEVDSRISAFYAPRTLEEASQRFGSVGEANQMLRGVRVAPTYNQHRSLFFRSYSDKTPSQVKFETRDGRTITIFEYFREKRLNVKGGMLLSNVRPEQAGQFPSDLLKIVPHQRINLDRMDSQQAETLHTQNAVLPDIRYQNIRRVIQNLNFTDRNPVLKAFNIKVANTFFSLPQSCITRPDVRLGTGKNAFIKPEGGFTNPSYVQPGSCPKWIVYHDSENERMIAEFVTTLIGQAASRGLQLPKPAIVSIKMATFMTKVLDQLKDMKDRPTMIMVIDSKRDNASHAAVKLVEPRLKIVVQHLDLANVAKTVAQHRNMTVENILNKINLKLGGINYIPSFKEEAGQIALDKNTFVIGYTVAHARNSGSRSIEGLPAIEPSVVGFTGNYGANPNLIVGNFLYQPSPRQVFETDENGKPLSAEGRKIKREAAKDLPPQELIDSKLIEDQVRRMLINYHKNRKSLPAFIIVMRDGLSEYQFDQALDIEFNAIKRGCIKASPTYKPKVTFMVTTKDHATRVFANTGSKIVNPTPGSLISTGIVRAGHEFVIIPHKAIKGTALPVKVTVLLDDSRLPIQAIQKFVHALAYSHQLTCAPTALPEPVYQAEVLAHRGIYMFQGFKQYFLETLQQRGVEDHRYNVDALTRMLSVQGSRLETIRYTA